MAWFKPKYKLNEVSQRFNLKDLLGREPTDREKDLFVENAIQYIQDRTQSGQDINGSSFTSYTKEYAEKKGVSRSDVDLTLMGNMLDSIRKENQRKNLVKVLIDEGDEVLKAYNHNVGDTLPRRTFFGLNEDEAKEIAQNIKQEQRRTIGDLLDEVGGLQGELLGDEG